MVENHDCDNPSQKGPQNHPIVDPRDPPPEVRKWINRFKRILKNMPEGLWLFANGTLYVMASGKDGRPVHTGFGGGYDQDYVIESIDTFCDGGDW